jgi:polar amino acid transport system permease protein
MTTKDIQATRALRPYLKASTIADIAKFLLVILLMTWLMARGTSMLDYNWQWYQVPKYIFSINEGRLMPGPLLKGLVVTLHIAGVSLILSFAFGLITAIFRLSHSFMARFIARIYLETIRNTPLLVQLFFIYFVLSPVFGISRFMSAVLALSLFEGAYASEILRSGIISIHKGQWEAAYSLGLSRFDTFVRIILPQAIRRILPPLSSQAISLVKDSALVSTIAIYDLTMNGRAIISETFLTFELWFTIAAIYLVITISMSMAVGMMENRLRIQR